MFEGAAESLDLLGAGNQSLASLRASPGFCGNRYPTLRRGATLISEPLPEGWRLIVESNPWKRLFEWWAWISFLGAVACGIIAGVNASRANNRSGLDADRAEELAVLWGFPTAGLLVWALVLAMIASALHRYRATIRPDYTDDEDEEEGYDEWRDQTVPPGFKE